MSFVELSIVAIIALLLLGPDQLPGAAKAIGKGLRDLRRASDDLKQTFEQEMVKLEAEVTPKAKPLPRPALASAADAIVETSPLSSSTGPLAAGLGAIALDQIHQAAPRVDPGALRAQARAAAAPIDPGAARAAARKAALAAHARAQLLVEASASDLEAKRAEAALEQPRASGAEEGAESLVDISDATEAVAAAPAPLPPEDEFTPLRASQPVPAFVAPTQAPPETVPRRKPDPS
jgi:sec-independent protein translocase protein TatB